VGPRPKEHSRNSLRSTKSSIRAWIAARGLTKYAPSSHVLTWFCASSEKLTWSALRADREANPLSRPPKKARIRRQVTPLILFAILNCVCCRTDKDLSGATPTPPLALARRAMADKAADTSAGSTVVRLDNSDAAVFRLRRSWRGPTVAFVAVTTRLYVLMTPLENLTEMLSGLVRRR